ncbi:MAG TPA: hypothetical protein HPP56_01810 [Nitrospirae bacterium]|nr:hypothetical protein [Nitrospirota bacterium]
MMVADKVILMKSGKIINEGKPKDIIVKRLIEETYGCPVDVIKENDELFIKLHL